MFRFARYDVRLEQGWLAHELGEAMSGAEILRLRPMDDPTNLDATHRIDHKAATLQVRREHLESFRRSEAAS